MKKFPPQYLLFFLLWFILQSNKSFGQANRLDSLRKVLPTTEDTTKVKTLNEIAYELYDKEPKEAIDFLEEALLLGKETDFTKGLARSNDLMGRSYSYLNNPNLTLTYYLISADYYKKLGDTIKLAEEYNEIGIIYKNLSQYEKSLTYYNLALDLLEDTNNDFAKGNTLINIGQSYSYLANYETAITFYIKAIKIWEHLNDKKGLALVYGNLGNLYYSLKDGPKALQYYQTAERLFRELGDKILLANVLNNIGLVYDHFKHEDEKALEYFNSALQLSKELDYKNGMALSLSNRAKLYQGEKRYKKAVENFELAIDVSREANNIPSITACLIDLGVTYTLLGDYEKGYTKIMEGLQIAKESNDTERELMSYKALFEYYEAIRKYNLSLEYYKKYTALKDSVFNIKKSEQITEIQTRYETQKKEQENKLLRKERIAREETISRKEAQNNLLLIGILFVLIFTSYFYVVNRQKRKTNLLLLRQNEEINIKQQEITKVNASLKESQKQLSEANEELQQLNSNLEATVKERTTALQKSHVELDTFLYQSSHALRRPIVSIMGLVKIARLEQEPGQITIIRDKIEDTAQKMDLMLRKLVMASEINISQFDPLKPIDFKSIIEEIWADLSESLPTAPIDFQMYLEPIGDFFSKEILVRILFQNIFENAILYTENNYPHKPIVKVFVRVKSKKICIEVLDNGSGIAPELSERIFDMFIVATDKPKGFGLGLYIVKKAVEKLNGSIEAKTQEDKFTCFQVILPYHHQISEV